MSLHKKKFNFEDPEDSYWNESGSISSSSLFDDLPSKQWAARAAVDTLFDVREEKLTKPLALASAPAIFETPGGDTKPKLRNDPGPSHQENYETAPKTKVAVEIFDTTTSNRAPSIISENSVSSLPSEAQRLDLDYNRLRAEHRKLQKHLETIRHERFQPLEVRETVKRLRKGEPVTLDLYRTKAEKLHLLQAAMDTYDSDIIQRIMIFLRTTLGDTAFREVLMFNPEAAAEFIEYLKTVQEYEQLSTVYLWLGRHDDAHMVEIAMAMRIRTPEQKMSTMRRIAQNEQIDPDVSYPVKSYVALLERQISIQNTDNQERTFAIKDGRINAPLPFNPTLGTLYYIILYHFKCFEGDIRNPQAFKTAMGLTDKEFIWVSISAHVHKERWQEIERLLEVKTGLFSPKVPSNFSWEFLFKLFYRCSHLPPITFLEKICRSIPETEIRQKISTRYKIPLINQPGIGQIIPGRQARIPFLGKRYMSIQGKFLAYRRIATTMPTMKELEQMIRIEPVTFDLPSGEQVTVESHIQDTITTGSDIGTVVCLHGSPGSYKDFKYITPYLYDKGIRVIGVNFPDYGLTHGHEKLNFDNSERNNYIKAVLDQVGVKDHLVVMGHSRGCENATGTAALLSDRLSGLVLLNPTGLRLHRGLRPFWLVPFVLWLHSINFIQNAIENFLYWFYNKIGLRLDSGRRAIACVRTMFHIELDKMKPKIDVINNTKRAKVLQAYSGKDLFIEPCVSKELAQTWQDHVEVVCKERTPEAADQITEKTASYFKSGTKSISAYFTEEDHFLQKHQPKFVADVIEIMLKS